jgi:hypothetical protein
MRQKFGLIIILGVLTFTACLDVESYPKEPTLSSSSVIVQGDSAILKISFIDGDGNFGLNEGDTGGVFSDCLHQYNVLADYQEKQNGVWITMSDDPCVNPNAIPFYYRAPWVQPPGQNKTQKGTISVLLFPAYYLLSNFDTCRFKVRICDRDFNYSNEVYTNEFVKPQ